MNLPTHITIEDGHLFIGRHDCVELAQEYGTPVYVTDEDRIRENYRSYQAALKKHYDNVQILYAAKANGNRSIMRVLAEEGAGADVFSKGEIHLASIAGIDPKKVLFNGSSKTPQELKLAVAKDILVSVDSLDELNQLNAIAQKAGKKVKIAFRVNPAIEVPTHPKIATGLKTSKFGIPAEQILDAYRAALACSNLEPVGMHCHIGSQILETEPFAKAAEVMVEVAKELVGIGVNLKFLDIGGGLGIPYHRSADETAPTPEEWADVVMPVFLEGFKKYNISPAIWVEPGRFLLGDSTVLLTGVNSVKNSHKKFVNVDAGFNLLLRPAMYDSYHEIIVAHRADAVDTETVTVTGPICETGDIIADDRDLPTVQAGDVLVILDAGAYGFSMSSQYNARPRCGEVMVKGDQSAFMRRHETVIDIVDTMESLPWHN